MLIPTTMRSYILRNIHAGHQGMEKCKLRAKTCVYWKGINADIEPTVKTCTVCHTNQSSQQAETLLPHDIPDGPWQVLATDIFHLDGNDYVIVVDYYSKMPFVRRLTSNSTSATVISALKQLFGEHGIPHKLLSDSGPQYDCVEIRTDICSRLGIQAHRKLTQIPRVQRICRTHGPDRQENHAQGKAEQY